MSDNLASASDVRALSEQLTARLQLDERQDREARDSLYMEAAAPLLKVGRLANEFSAAGSLRAGELPSHLGAGSMQQLTEKRDMEAASRMPRSAGSWSSEQERPGSWMSGVGAITPVGFGRQTPIGHGRPVFQQGE